MVVLLGLTDFYLNVRAAERMSVHLFVPLSFAFGTSLQCLQAMLIFDEFKGMTVFHSAMTLRGACLSLVGALMIRPPQFEARDRTVIPVPTGESPGRLEVNIRMCVRRSQRGFSICQQKAM